MEDLIGVELVVLHVLLIVWLFCMHLSILFYNNTSLVYKTFYSKTSFHCIKLLIYLHPSMENNFILKFYNSFRMYYSDSKVRIPDNEFKSKIKL